MSTKRTLLIITAGILFGGAATLAAVPPGDDFNRETAQAAAALQQWYNTNGLWDTTGWWNAANCVEAIENVITAQNGGPYLSVLDETFRHNSRGNFLNDYYDDEGWWALAWIRAFDLTGEVRYLNAAKIIFQDMTGGWDSHCGGGIWWRKERDYKNAVANELFLLVAVRLHQRTPEKQEAGRYLDWALREWAWFDKSGMINLRNLVNDGLNEHCENNQQTTWTYNQGVILGGLAELYKSTADTNYLNRAQAIADAAIAALSNSNGILAEPCEPDHCGGGDVPQFKGIFIHHLAELYDLTRKPAFYQFLLANARSIWANDRDPSNHFGLRWTGPVDSVDAARHSSAMMAITALAEPSPAGLVSVSNAVGALGWTAATLAHDVGQAEGLNAWCADPLRNHASGYLSRGPNARGLSAGRHNAIFELKVDNFNRDRAKVCTLSVIEISSGRIIASRVVRRSDFTTTLYRPFGLTFNASTGGNYDCRVFWRYTPGAPRLTQSSLSIR